MADINPAAPHYSGSNHASDKDAAMTPEHYEKTVGGVPVHGDIAGDRALMAANAEARIKNPLGGIPRDQLLRDVDAFCAEKGLMEHVAVFRKGALVAQDPDSRNSLTGEFALDSEETRILDDEVTHRWRMPAKLFLTIAVCSIGACVQGWDQTGINGANIFMPKAYGIAEKTALNNGILGVVNAGPYIGSAFIGCWLADPLNNWFGRRGVIFISAHFCIWPVIASGFCNTWQQQLACRLLMGIGMGVKGATVPVYAAENAPASIRGALVMSWQMWTAFGIFLGTCINLAVYYHPHNWRLMVGAPFIPAVPLLCLIYLCPESPRWYMKKNRYPEAFKAMNRLRYTPLQVARDIYYIHSQLVLEQEIMRESNFATRFGQLFTIPRVRRATVAAFVVMIAQQMCGINIIAFYSTTVFVDNGADEYTALLSSLGFGAINWLFAFPAFYTIDTFGRRSLLLFTFPNMAWTLLAAGLLTLLPEGSTRTGLVAFFIYLFAMFYSPGEGPVPFAYSAEVFPLSHREMGMGFAVATCLFWASILSITFPWILESLKVVGAFGLYAGFNMVAFVMIFYLVPETKQRTLEELDYVFAVPMGKFAKYQMGTAAPHFVKRYLLFQKNHQLKPLYQFDQPTHQAGNGSDSEKKVAL